MQYARHVGRIGALSVALGVGWAVASAPGVAFAQPADADSVSTPPDDSGQAPNVKESDDADAVGDEPAVDGDEAVDDADAEQPIEDADEIEADADARDDDPARGGPDAKDPDTDEPDTNDPDADDLDADDLGDINDDSEGGDALFVDDVDDAADTGAAPSQRRTLPPVDEDSTAEADSDDVFTTLATAAVTAEPATATARTGLVGVVTDLITSLLSPGQGSPLQTPLLTAALSAVRDEIERIFAAFATSKVANEDNIVYVDPDDLDAETLALLAADNEHVLLIGVDGTNLEKILADDYNQAFFDLMNDGTTAASTVVGHTTISNPSWTTIQTGVWSETAGVINNIFTPWTYDTWSTVYNQLETFDPNVNTTVIADWAVIAKIAGAGSARADTIQYIVQEPDDPDWTKTTNAVGAASVTAIQNTHADAPSLQFTYFTGVDINGHEHGGDSPEYARHIRVVNDNLAEMMDAVDKWEKDHPGETFTVIVTTDHGHQPQQGVGHGFQSPRETSTFVIAEDKNYLTGVSDNFEQGAINNTYRIVDITPTIVDIFGLAPEPWSQGVPLMDRGASTYKPSVAGQDALHLALNDAIDMYGYPDIATQVSLGIRTVFATPPYLIYNQTVSIADQSPEFLQPVVYFFGTVSYQTFNIPAQIIGRATGVDCNQIIPPDWNPFTPLPPETASATLLSISGPACGDPEDANCAA